MILLLTTRVSERFPMNCAAKIDCLLWKQTDTGNTTASGNTKKKAHPTLRGMVKTDVEMAMTTADCFAGFIAELQKMGYAVKYGPKTAHMAVRHKEAQKNIRLNKINPHLSEDSLRRYFRELHIICCVMIS